MARELGMNPKQLGKLDNHRQEPWKAPLPIFIEDLYQKRFGKERPAVVVTIEERARLDEQKKRAKREAKLARKLQLGPAEDPPQAQAERPSSLTDRSDAD
jgi:hypothetical protein